MFNLTATLKQDEKIAILTSDGTLIITAGKSYDRSNDLKKLCIEHSTLSLLSRNPEGLNYETMFQAYFLDGAQKTRLTELSKDADDYRSKSIYQSIQIDDILTEPGKDGIIYGLVKGQLVLNGKFGDSSFVYPENFRLTLTMVKNPRVGMNGYAPYVVNSYVLKKTKSSSAINIASEDKSKEGNQ